MEKDDIFKELIKHVEKIVSELFDESPAITNETYFCELGASSCDRAVIVADTLNSLSINTPVEEVLVASTVGEMVELIYRGAKLSSAKEKIRMPATQYV